MSDPKDDTAHGYYIWLDGVMTWIDEDLGQPMRPDETWTHDEIEALRGAFDAIWGDDDE